MKILFLGNFLPRKYESIFKTLSAAGNQYQNNLIKALECDNEVVAITYSGLPEVRLSKQELVELSKSGIDVCLPKVEGYSNIFRYRHRIKEVAQTSDCVITYNVIYLWFGLRSLIKNNKCKLILVLADYTPPKEEKGWRKIYSWLMGKQFAKYDKVVLLSEKSRLFINDDKKCKVINGCIDWELFKNINPPKQKEECVIAYTGFISKVTGIELLIEAYNKIKKNNCRLIISGQVDEQEREFLEKASNINHTITYLGYVDKSRYIELLQQADVLVNPRDMSFEQNQYNFPSKILEYLASGRVVVSTKFSGYEKYDNYIEFCDSEIESLTDKLASCIENKDELLEISFKKNREFVQQFTWQKQSNQFL